jgi:hypothetical protein
MHKKQKKYANIRKKMPKIGKYMPQKKSPAARQAFLAAFGRFAKGIYYPVRDLM